LLGKKTRFDHPRRGYIALLQNIFGNEAKSEAALSREQKYAAF
jgi:hypothetical protein